VSRSRLLRLEASAHLVAARLAVRLLPYRVLTRLFELSSRRPEFTGSERARICLDVRSAVEGASRRLPGSVCLPRALAAQAMLRRRGITTTLYLGVARSPAAPHPSHAWLKDGELGVAGTRASGDYHAVASYSAKGAG
jgi:hypothetical protein